MSNPDEILEELTSPKICFTEPKVDKSQGAWCENCYGLMNRNKLKIKSKALLDFDNPSSGFLGDNIQQYFLIMTSFCLFENAEKMKFEFFEGDLKNMVFTNQKWFEMAAPPSYIAWPLLHYLSEFFDLNIYSLNGAQSFLKIKHRNKIFENNKVSFECSHDYYKVNFEFNFS